jgi:hypothetical protein
VTRGPNHHWFGYYDKTPWDASGRYLLALEVESADRSPGPDDVATLGVVDLADGERYVPFAETRAWNWQQGCMLQWLPGTASSHVIYNDRVGDRFVSIVADALTGTVVRSLPLPIYAVSHDGTRALSLNFARLHRERPGYGYAGVPDPWSHEPAPRDDGIYLLNLQTDRYRLLVPVSHLAAMTPQPSMAAAVHRFNHLQFCPDDSLFAFLHRWRPYRRGARPKRQLATELRGLTRLVRGTDEFSRIGAARRLTGGLLSRRRLLAEHYGDGGLSRLCAARADGSQIAVLMDEYLASHFDWLDSGHILVWGRRGGVDVFYLVEASTGEAAPVAPGAISEDGHCSYSPDPDRRWILGDTYPDALGYRALYVYDTRRGLHTDLGSYFSPPRMTGELRCDLHPRWSRDGRQICFDSAHEDSRQIYVMDVSPAP